MTAPDISIADLDPVEAKRIIQAVGGPGQPPVYGYQFFTAGIGDYLSTIENEYLADSVYHGGSAFKLIVGTYGGGKTHFLYCVRGISWDYDYVSSYIELKPDETPFYNLESVYKEVVASLLYPQDPKSLQEGYDKGIEAVIKTWYYRKTQGILENKSEKEQQEIIKNILSTLGPYESTSYLYAIKHAFSSLHKNDEESFNLIVQWLKGEKPSAAEMKKFQITQKLDKSTAFKFLKCLIRWLKEIGYSGLIVLMDEAEQTPSMSSKQKEKLMGNLRELVDACSSGDKVKNSMFFYAVPDESFLEGSGVVYVALKDRLSTVFEGARNPAGIKIYLERTGDDTTAISNLIEIGEKLALIYEKAYQFKLDNPALKTRISDVAKKAYEDKHAEISYKRLFVQEIIKNFHAMKAASLAAS